MSSSARRKRSTNGSYKAGEKQKKEQADEPAQAEQPAMNGAEGSAEEEPVNERERLWRENPYAVGLTDPDWSWKSWRCKYFIEGGGWTKFITVCCCNCCASRVGNMVVLNTSSSGHPRIMVGPYWPVMVCLTYPLILGLSLATAVLEIPYSHVAIVAVWSCLTFILIASLACVACRNPGIMKRHTDPPEDDWIWNDQALTFRPRNAKYDPETACVVEAFDHTCPWTGTAIGKYNMPYFRVFVTLVAVMFCFNVGLLVARFVIR